MLKAEHAKVGVVIPGDRAEEALRGFVLSPHELRGVVAACMDEKSLSRTLYVAGGEAVPVRMWFLREENLFFLSVRNSADDHATSRSIEQEIVHASALHTGVRIAVSNTQKGYCEIPYKKIAARLSRIFSDVVMDVEDVAESVRFGNGYPWRQGHKRQTCIARDDQYCVTLNVSGTEPLRAKAPLRIAAKSGMLTVELPEFQRPSEWKSVSIRILFHHRDLPSCPAILPMSDRREVARLADLLVHIRSMK